MAKNKIILLFLLGLTGLVGAAGREPVSSSSRHCILSVAVSQVGVRELSGHNDGAAVEKYLSSVHLRKGNPWCAAFCAWTYDQCGTAHPVSGYCPDWFRVSVLYMRSTVHYAKAPVDSTWNGCVFGIWFPSKKRIAHVGIIEKVDKFKGIVCTIEGNTNEEGSREGDGVYRKKRLIRQVYAVRCLTTGGTG